MIVLVCLFIGLMLKRFHYLPDNFPASLNYFAFNISLPALVLRHLHELPLTPQLLAPFISPWISCFIALAAIYIARKIWHWDRTMTGCMIVMCCVSNTSFVGLPLVKTLIGETALPIALAVDQSNFIVLTTLVLILANFYSGSVQSSAKQIILQILKQRSIQAIVLALILKPIPFSQDVLNILDQLGATLTPLTLISLGASITLNFKSTWLIPLSIGLSIKLIVVPLIIFGLFYPLRAGHQEMFNVILLQAGMAPMVFSALMATEKKLMPELAMMMVSIGIIISFITGYLWLQIA